MNDLAWICAVSGLAVTGISGMAFGILQIWKTGRLNG